MLANINIGKQKDITCKCGHIMSYHEDIKQCENCGLVLKEIQFDTGNTFTDSRPDGQVYDLDEQQGDRSLNADKNIGEMITSLKLNSEYPEYLDRIGATPLRIIKFAYKGMFLDHGTNVLHYSAAALYIALRFYKAPFLLMDFSEKLSVNLFKLAKCYRKLAKFLNVTLKLNEKLPAIDPSLYIPRFCKEIDFGEQTESVKNTAIKLLKRMKLDWMAHGRRPSSLCGAAILIAGRMHGFNITTGEVCQIVLVCEETLRKRLEEFKETEVASLTREKFDEIDIEKMQVEKDPPAFYKKQQQQQQLQQKQIEQENSKNNDNNLNLTNKKQQKIDDKFQSKYQINKDIDISIEKLESEKQDFNKIVEDIQHTLDNDHSSKSDIKENYDDFDMKKMSSQNQSQKQENQLILKQDLKNEEFELQKQKISILQERGNINEDEVLSELSDDDEQYLLSGKEKTVKSILWHSMNQQWLEEQQRKIPKLALEQKDKKKRIKKRNDQLLNADDPVIALMQSKNKKVKNNLDEKSLRELFQKQVIAVKSTGIRQVFENDNGNLGQISFKKSMINFSNMPGSGIGIDDTDQGSSQKDTKNKYQTSFSRPQNTLQFSTAADDWDQQD